MYKIKRREIGTSRIFFGDAIYSDTNKEFAEKTKEALKLLDGKNYIFSVVKM